MMNINSLSGKILIQDMYYFFKSEEIAENFLREQRELLEIAKPLL